MPALPPASSTADALKLEAQQVLDELFRRHLIRFQLTAFKVELTGLNKYMIYFYDSRFDSVMVSWVGGESFSDVFRSAILDHVLRMA
jgi:hypothetical protein